MKFHYIYTYAAILCKKNQYRGSYERIHAIADRLVNFHAVETVDCQDCHFIRN